MRKFFVTLALSVLIGAGYAAPAMAADTGCCRDGKPASAAAQKAACKGTSGDTYRACVSLAKLPDWWLASSGGVNTHVGTGVSIVNSLRKSQPYYTWKAEFRSNVKAYRDQHVTVPMN